MSKCKPTTLCHTSGSVPGKDAITKQTVFTWVIFGVYRTCMHIRPILTHSMYRAVSDEALNVDQSSLDSAAEKHMFDQ